MSVTGTIIYISSDFQNVEVLNYSSALRFLCNSSERSSLTCVNCAYYALQLQIALEEQKRFLAIISQMYHYSGEN